MPMMRQVQLRRGSTTLDLNTSPYDMVAGSWTAAGPQLEMRVLVQATTLSELRRYVAAVRQLLNQAQHYAAETVGSAVYVYTKTCDDLTTTAELGATWLRKRIRAGAVLEQDASELATGRYALTLIVSLETDDTWRRAAPVSLLAAAARGDFTVGSDGSLTITVNKSLTARRIAWTATSGFTLRVRWSYADGDMTFFRPSVSYAALAIYSLGDNKLHIYDCAGNVAHSAALTSPSGTELDLVFKWDPLTPKMGIWVNGIANGTVAQCTLDSALSSTASYKLFAPTEVNQTVYSAQIWPAALTDAQCAGLSAWGRPEPELMVYVLPTDTKNTNAAYRIYNVPGEADAKLRLLLSDATQAYDKFRVGIRPLRIQTTALWECEAGTNGTDVADAADASASGGNIAQFTPSATSYATRSTIVLAANPADMSAFYGQYRLLLAVKDNAAAIGINVIKWRLVCAGVAGDYSDEYSAAAVATYSLLDLGTLTLPPGEWPEETETCTTDVVGGAYLTLEIQAKNTSGNGGGTLNLDAVYLQPVELEGVVDCASLTTAQFMAVDFASDPPAAIVVASATSLEYAAFGTYLGDELALAPAYGDAGLLMVYAYRDTAEKAYPNDAVTVYPFMRPGWL